MSTLPQCQFDCLFVNYVPIFYLVSTAQAPSICENAILKILKLLILLISNQIWVLSWLILKSIIIFNSSHGWIGTKYCRFFKIHDCRVWTVNLEWSSNTEDLKIKVPKFYRSNWYYTLSNRWQYIDWFLFMF